eukprot:123417_1
MVSTPIFNCYTVHTVRICFKWNLYQFQFCKSIIYSVHSNLINRQGSLFATGINHGCTKNFIDLDERIVRYISILWRRMIGLDQNVFVGLLKCQSIRNDYNGIIIKFTLQNIFA